MPPVRISAASAAVITPTISQSIRCTAIVDLHCKDAVGCNTSLPRRLLRGAVCAPPPPTRLSAHVKTKIKYAHHAQSHHSSNNRSCPGLGLGYSLLIMDITSSSPCSAQPTQVLLTHSFTTRSLRRSPQGHRQPLPATATPRSHLDTSGCACLATATPYHSFISVSRHFLLPSGSLLLLRRLQHPHRMLPNFGRRILPSYPRPADFASLVSFLIQCIGTASYFVLTATCYVAVVPIFRLQGSLGRISGCAEENHESPTILGTRHDQACQRLHERPQDAEPQRVLLDVKSGPVYETRVHVYEANLARVLLS